MYPRQGARGLLVDGRHCVHPLHRVDHDDPHGHSFTDTAAVDGGSGTGSCDGAAGIDISALCDIVSGTP